MQEDREKVPKTLLNRELCPLRKMIKERNIDLQLFKTNKKNIILNYII